MVAVSSIIAIRIESIVASVSSGLSIIARTTPFSTDLGGCSTSLKTQESPEKQAATRT